MIEKISKIAKLASAVWGVGKQEEHKEKTLFSCSHTAPSFLHKYGEDACFVSSTNTMDIIGIADGVGGWRKRGVDPSKFSFGLMEACKKLIDSEDVIKKPTQLLASAYEMICTYEAPPVGSSTAVILMFDRLTRKLNTANLGDSGFMVVRENKIVHRTLSQQHRFNAPYQLSIRPEGSKGLNDKPEDSQTEELDLEIGDIIVMASDGFFDNLFDEDILKILSHVKEGTLEEIEKTVSVLGEKAVELAADKTYMSPFSVEAQKLGYLRTVGGKVDDVTVIVSVVQADEKEDKEWTFKAKL